MNLRSATYALWFAGPILQLFLAGLIYRRGLRRQFPVFFLYTLAQPILFLPQFVFYRISYTAYFWSYWFVSFTSVLLGFFVMREVFVNLLRPYDSLRQLGDILFRWAAVVLVMVAVVSAASTSLSGLSRTTVAILALERSVRVMQCGLVLFMLLFSSHLGLNARHHVFGIALGFGIFAAVQLVIVTLPALIGAMQTLAVTLATGSTYLIAVGLWFYYLCRPEPERKPIEARVETQRWDVALAGMQNQIPQESFMTAVEDAVERVLTRRQSECGR
jgi:hypothetical protein